MLLYAELQAPVNKSAVFVNKSAVNKSARLSQGKNVTERGPLAVVGGH